MLLHGFRETLVLAAKLESVVLEIARGFLADERAWLKRRALRKGRRHGACRVKFGFADVAIAETNAVSTFRSGSRLCCLSLNMVSMRRAEERCSMKSDAFTNGRCSFLI